MKRQIRRGVFETNSSSTHSLTMCLKSDYDKWANGELLLYTGWGYGYPEDHRPEENHFYTKEQVIEFEKISNYPPSDDMDWDSEEAEEQCGEYIYRPQCFEVRSILSTYLNTGSMIKLSTIWCLEVV